MNRSTLRLLALVLPLLGLAGAWTVTHHRAEQGVEWDVPVMGYDPRDLLRGHYIQYQYDWPGLDPTIGADGQPFLCLIGTAPRIDRTHPLFGFDMPSEPPRETCPIPVVPDAGGSLLHGRLYVPQTQAPAMEAKLRDPKLQAFVRIRLRPDGHVTPLAMNFRPRTVGP